LVQKAVIGTSNAEPEKAGRQRQHRPAGLPRQPRQQGGGGSKWRRRRLGKERCVHHPHLALSRYKESRTPLKAGTQRWGDQHAHPSSSAWSKLSTASSSIEASNNLFVSTSNRRLASSLAGGPHKPSFRATKSRSNLWLGISGTANNQRMQRHP
jgi:hypothetical protein